MNIFIVAMPGSGNLGDDLISGLLVKKIFNEYRPEHVGILCGENNIDNYYQLYLNKITFLKKPQKKNYKEFYRRRKRINNFIKDCDLILVGGGGLLQDSHSPFTIYNYLKYTQKFKKRVLLLGVGVGPINFSFNRWYLQKILNDKYLIQVRDYESKEFLQSIGVKTDILVNYDIVEGSGKDDYIKHLENLSKSDFIGKKKVLGCNIRKWEDIEISNLILYIREMTETFDIDLIKFFVFENGIGNTTEKQFTQSIIDRLSVYKNIKSELFVYNETDNIIFFENFYSVEIAIASRYHANILWQLNGIKTLPIVYSPKVRSLYTKYNITTYTFNELIQRNMPNKYPFVLLQPLTEQYRLPKDHSLYVERRLSVRFINGILAIFSFFFEVYKSIRIRINFYKYGKK